MPNNEKNKYSKVFQHLIAFTFLISAILKLIDFEATSLMLQNIFYVDIVLTKTILFLLIIIELSISAFLVFNIFRMSTKYALFFLSVMFIGFNLVLAYKGIDNCGCFGAFIKQAPFVGIIKNIAIIGMIYKI